MLKIITDKLFSLNLHYEIYQKVYFDVKCMDIIYEEKTTNYPLLVDNNSESMYN